MAVVWEEMTEEDLNCTDLRMDRFAELDNWNLLKMDLLEVEVVVELAESDHVLLRVCDYRIDHSAVHCFVDCSTAAPFAARYCSTALETSWEWALKRAPFGLGCDCESFDHLLLLHPQDDQSRDRECEKAEFQALPAPRDRFVVQQSLCREWRHVKRCAPLRTRPPLQSLWVAG